MIVDTKYIISQIDIYKMVKKSTKKAAAAAPVIEEEESDFSLA